MAFCGHCTRFANNIGKDYNGEYYLHQPSFSALLNSSRECQLCGMIVDRLRETGQIESIVAEAETGYPTTITIVGVDHNGPWKYYPQFSEKCHWKGLIGIQVHCGAPNRNDDWYCEFGLSTDHGKSAAALITLRLLTRNWMTQPRCLVTLRRAELILLLI
jgi:hypothetical protein